MQATVIPVNGCYFLNEVYLQILLSALFCSQTLHCLGLKMQLKSLAVGLC